MPLCSVPPPPPHPCPKGFALKFYIRTEDTGRRGLPSPARAEWQNDAPATHPVGAHCHKHLVMRIAGGAWGEREKALLTSAHMLRGPTLFPRSLISPLDVMPHPPARTRLGYGRSVARGEGSDGWDVAERYRQGMGWHRDGHPTVVTECMQGSGMKISWRIPLSTPCSGNSGAALCAERSDALVP